MNNTPLPMDMAALVYKVGAAEIRILQLEYQVRLLTEELNKRGADGAKCES